jgi:hypothetical protein
MADCIKTWQALSSADYMQVYGGCISALLAIFVPANRWRCRSRAVSTLTRTSADVSPGRMSRSYWKSTRGTCMWMSIHSIICPVMCFFL